MLSNLSTWSASMFIRILGASVNGSKILAEPLSHFYEVNSIFRKSLSFKSTLSYPKFIYLMLIVCYFHVMRMADEWEVGALKMRENPAEWHGPNESKENLDLTCWINLKVRRIFRKYLIKSSFPSIITVLFIFIFFLSRLNVIITGLCAHFMWERKQCSML